ncbi:uncharacterized protein LTR77_004839 [Saxophila tyrrhenica]|uniref:3'-5' exonuclease domain-containing protein n=1 Tax=Saxophila tyrrhenica TaxID=1690608 RepID=A0AAV9PEC8_9PEZI|nr:hypothetical protein LTR77_004839 [Saxophila tyrrhenica]
MEPELIDTVSALKSCLSDLQLPARGPPSLYMDLEDNDLCREGTLSLLALLVVPRDTIHVIDVTTLGKEAFASPGSTHTLKSILESESIVKVFFDISNDSDALYSHFGVRVAGIQDVQLMELATRGHNKRCVNGLARCIESDAQLGYEERREWREMKNKGRRLFAPELGGSYAVFDRRPLDSEIIKYCAQDVQLLPKLRSMYCQQLCDAWWLKIKEETEARIQLSQSPKYNGKGRNMTLGPPAWSSWSPTVAERGIRVLLEQQDKPNHEGEVMSAAAAAGPSEAEGSPGQPTSEASDTELGPIARALQEMRSTSERSNSSDGEDDEYGYRHGYMSPGRAYSYDSGDGTGPDLTACDKECGYCGHCPY